MIVHNAKIHQAEVAKKEDNRLCDISSISLALQDGLGFKKMKSLETFGNCKKLKYR
jgi:hypothetical protein